jgi:hypothetical protein
VLDAIAAEQHQPTLGVERQDFDDGEAPLVAGHDEAAAEAETAHDIGERHDEREDESKRQHELEIGAEAHQPLLP